MTSKAEIRLGAVDDTGSAFDSVKRRLSGLSQEAKDFGDNFASVGGRIGPLVAAIGAGLAALSIKDKIDLADEVGDLSEMTGVAVDKLTELRYAGRQNGAEFETLGKGLEKLNLNISKAAEGSKQQAQAFDLVGVKVKNLDGSLRSADQVLGDVADRFATLNDGPEKAALAVELFGKEGTKLISMLNIGSEGIASFAAEARELGVVFDGDLSAAAGSINDNLDKLLSRLEGVQIQIASELIPTIALLAEEAASTEGPLSGIGETIGAGLRIVTETVAVLGANVSFVLQGTGREIGAIAAQISALARLDIDGFVSISEAVKEDAERARKELDDFEARVLGLAKLGDGRRDAASDPRALGVAGSIAQQERAAQQSERAAATKALSDARRAQAEADEKARAAAQAHTKALADQKREMEAQRKVLVDLAGLTPTFAEDWDRLTAIYKSGAITLQQLTDAQAALLAKQPAMSKAAAEEAKLREASARWSEEAFNRLQALADENKVMAQQVETLGMTVAQVQYLEAARLRDNAAAQEAQAIRLADKEGYEDHARALREEARLLRERASIVEEGAGKQLSLDLEEANRESVKAATAEWQKGADQVSQSLTDALMEGGKSGSEYVEGLFRSMVLRPVISAVMQPIGNTINSALSGGSSVASMASTASSVGGLMGSGTFLGSAGGILGAAGNFGAGFGVGLQGLLGGSLSGITTGTSLMGAGSTMGGLGAIAGTVLPIVGVVATLASILGNRNKWSGSFGEATIDSLGAADISQRSTFSNSTYSADLSKGTGDLGRSIAAAVASFGGEFAGLAIRQFSATASKKDRAQAGTDLFVDGEFLSTGSVEVKKDEQAQAFADQALRATLAVLQRTVEGRFGDYFATIDAMTGDMADVSALLETAQAVRSLTETLSWMGGEFDTLATIGVQATADLAAAAGGFDQLATMAGAAYQVLYTEQERLGFLTEDVAAKFGDLGITMPQTVDQYRASLETVREAMDAGTAGAAEQYATLLALVPAWQQVTQAAADTIDQITKRLEDEGRSLQVDLLRAQGDTAGADALRRSIDTQGMTAAQVALYDYNQALRDQVSALEEAAARAEQVAAERDSLELQYLQTIGDVSAVRERELAALDESTRALQKQIWAIEDANAAFDRQKEVLADLAADVEGLFTLRGSAGDLMDKLSVSLGGAATIKLQREATMWAELGTAGYERQIELAGTLADMVIERQQTEIANAERLIDLGKGLRTYVESLRVGDLSPLTTPQKLAQAGATYYSTLERAGAGDTDAAGQVQALLGTYLQLARTTYASGSAYTDIFNRATGAAEGLGISLESASAGGSPTFGQLQQLYEVTAAAYQQADRDYQAAVDSLSVERELLTVSATTVGRLDEVRDVISSLPAEIAAAMPPVEVPEIDWSVFASGNDHLLEEIRALRAELAGLRGDRNIADAHQIMATGAAAQHVAGVVSGAIEQAARVAQLHAEAVPR